MIHSQRTAVIGHVMIFLTKCKCICTPTKLDPKKTLIISRSTCRYRYINAPSKPTSNHPIFFHSSPPRFLPPSSHPIVPSQILQSISHVRLPILALEHSMAGFLLLKEADLMEKEADEGGLQEEWQEECGYADEAEQAREKEGCIEA